MPTLIHHTSLDRAISIVRTCVYKPAQSAGDEGLNAFVVGKPMNRGQWIEATGAVLKFDWSGPTRVNNVSPFEPNVLHENLPWRAFVPVGSTKYLRVIGLEADNEAWENQIETTPWYCLSGKMKAAYRQKHAKILKRKIEDRIATHPSVEVHWE